MKIGLLIPVGLERPSGVRYANIARGLVVMGHQVSIIALHPDFAQCTQRRFRWHGVDVQYVGQMHARKAGGHPDRFGPLALLRVVMQSAAAMAAAATRTDVDCFHLGKPQPINGAAGLLVSRARRRPMYLDCDDYEAGSNRFGFEWQRRIFAWWEDHLPLQAHGVTANTRFLAERVQRLGMPRVVRVPNGIDREHFQPLPPARRTALRRGVGLNGDFVVGYVGSLSLNNHPVDLLLQAFAQLPRRNAKLLIVGGGEDAAYLYEIAAKLKIAERVRFTGHVSLNAVPAFTSMCDLTVDPVHDDDVARARCPLKLIESMALGIPMITGDVGDRRDLLGNGDAGMLVQPGSPEALTEGILTLMDDTPRRVAMSYAAQERVAEYDWGSLAQRWQMVYC